MRSNAARQFFSAARCAIVLIFALRYASKTHCHRTTRSGGKGAGSVCPPEASYIIATRTIVAIKLLTNECADKQGTDFSYA